MRLVVFVGAQLAHLPPPVLVDPSAGDQLECLFFSARASVILPFNDFQASSRSDFLLSVRLHTLGLNWAGGLWKGTSCWQGIGGSRDLEE
jgi:hypothetical protein